MQVKLEAFARRHRIATGECSSLNDRQTGSDLMLLAIIVYTDVVQTM